MHDYISKNNLRFFVVVAGKIFFFWFKSCFCCCCCRCSCIHHKDNQNINTFFPSSSLSEKKLRNQNINNRFFDIREKNQKKNVKVSYLSDFLFDLFRKDFFHSSSSSSTLVIVILVAVFFFLSVGYLSFWHKKRRKKIWNCYFHLIVKKVVCKSGICQKKIFFLFIWFDTTKM